MHSEHDANWALVPLDQPAWMRPGRGHRRARAGRGRNLFLATLILALVSACSLMGCGGGGCEEDCPGDVSVPKMACAASAVCLK